jgi:hypothetical protein
MPSYSPSEPVVRRPAIPSTQLSDETVLLSVEQQSYFGMRATSQRIWQLLEQPRTLQQILDALLLEYEVDPQQCQREVTAFMDSLWAAGLIQPAIPSASTSPQPGSAQKRRP